MAIMVFAPCVASGLVHSYGPMLSQKRFGLAATTVGNKAIFAGGRTVGGAVSDVVDIYDMSLGAPTNPAAWSTAKLSQAREWLCAVTVGDKAIFAGGRLSDSSGTFFDRVDIYDASSGTWTTASLSQARYALAATTVSSKAFFAGGRGYYVDYAIVDIYDSTLGSPTNPAAWSTHTLSHAQSWLSGVTVGSKAIFAGGYYPYSKVVDIYDSTLGSPTNPAAWYTAELSQARNGIAAISLGDIALFAWGSTDTTSYAVVDIYDASLGTWSTSNLSQARYNLSATTLGNIGIFGGGNDLSGNYFDRVDIYDASLGEPTDPAAWSTDALSQARANLDAITVGDFAMFAGGQVGSNYSDVVDIYSSWLKVSIDIKPGGCPNPLNVKDKGVLPVAICGTEDFDVWTIDTASIRLEDVAPVRSSYEDVATPMPDGAEVCECTTEGSDGYLDLVLKFNVQDIVATLGEVEDGDEFELTLMGELADGTPIQGKDCIVVITKGGK